MNIRQIFLQHQAQTSPAPIGLHIVKAKGNYLIDTDGKAYLDLIGGISVCNVGHSHPKVVKAIQEQAENYLHIMVYGELIQNPQAIFAQKLTQRLPASLDCVYFTNSGTEACETALKAARRKNGKSKIIAANKSYHGHTLGALSIMGSEYWRNAFRPLLPGIYHFDYNSWEMIDHIDEDTCCVIIESVQSEAGIIKPDTEWLKTLRKTCTQTGTLLIFDEIQTGFGRTGRLWGFEHSGVVPDILLLGKALGGGMPMGAMITSQNIMQGLSNNPVLGHMTTFGGHPVCCAAGIAALEVLESERLIEAVHGKENLFHELLRHPAIKTIRSAGLMMAVELESSQKVLACLHYLLEFGFFSDWFLFADNCIRIAPPLSISEEEIKQACLQIQNALDKI